ncbi:MAG: Gmad2 immunoglobulin-like domain-containing protein [Patescibacteria group bacterium]
MTTKQLLIVVVTLLATGLLAVAWWYNQASVSDLPGGVACTEEAKICPDGTVVVRSGPECTFAPCPSEQRSTTSVPADIQSAIAAQADRIRVSEPEPLATVSTPLQVSGEARGSWYFEGDFPVIVTDWDGRIIGEGFATAQDEWMTEEFVPFAGSIAYDLPADAYSATGTIIFQRDNPSGLPEHDAALEFPVRLR